MPKLGIKPGFIKLVGVRTEIRRQPIPLNGRSEIIPVQKQINRSKEIVYKLWHQRLGDLWVSINVALTKQDPYISTLVGKNQRKEKDETSRIKEIISLLDHKCNYTLVHGSDNNIYRYERIKLPRDHCGQYFPTKISWKEGNYYKIAYQFDGRSSASAKNPPIADVEKLFKKFSHKFKFIRLGDHVSLEENVKLAANADIFIGSCSGMSHLCHSVRVPMYLLQYSTNIEKWHRNNPYTLCHGMDDAILKINKYFQSKGMLPATRQNKPKLSWPH